MHDLLYKTKADRIKIPSNFLIVSSPSHLPHTKKTPLEFGHFSTFPLNYVEFWLVRGNITKPFQIELSISN